MYPKVIELEAMDAIVPTPTYSAVHRYPHVPIIALTNRFHLERLIRVSDLRRTPESGHLGAEDYKKLFTA